MGHCRWCIVIGLPALTVGRVPVLGANPVPFVEAKLSPKEVLSWLWDKEQ